MLPDMFTLICLHFIDTDPSQHLLNVLLQIANKLGLSNKKIDTGTCRSTAK
jgi:hypothetical protein